MNYDDAFLIVMISACMDDALYWHDQIEIGFYTNSEFLMHDSIDKALYWTLKLEELR